MGTLTFLRKCLTPSTSSICFVRLQHIQASRLYLDEFGDPVKVVKKEEFTLNPSDVKDNKVTVQLNNSGN